MNGLQTLYNEIVSFDSDNTGEYNTRMYHQLPNTEVIDRRLFILDKCNKKVVLDVGCAGPIHGDIQQVAKKAYGIDMVPCKFDNFILWDFEASRGEFPPIFLKEGEKFDLIFCGEIMEHLSNPGLFLQGIRESECPVYDCPVIFTVPNAYCAIHPAHILRGREHVNADHVCFYSWHTFKTLLERYKYRITEFYWYDSPGQVSQQGLNEGCVFVTEHGT